MRYQRYKSLLPTKNKSVGSWSAQEENRVVWGEIVVRMDILGITDRILDGSGEDSRAVEDMAASLAQQLGSEPSHPPAPTTIRNSPSPGSTITNRTVGVSSPNIAHTPVVATATLNGTRPAVTQPHQFVNVQSVGQATSARPTATASSGSRPDGAAYNTAMVQKLQEPGMREKVNRLRQFLGRLIDMATQKDQKFGVIMRELVKKLLVRYCDKIN